MRSFRWNKLKTTREELRERTMLDLLESARVGEVVELPWGERVTLLPEGELRHELPLTTSQMRRLRAALAGDPDPRPSLLRLLLGKR